jgi:hypothetical protein
VAVFFLKPFSPLNNQPSYCLDISVDYTAKRGQFCLQNLNFEGSRDYYGTQLIEVKYFRKLFHKHIISAFEVVSIESIGM